MKVTHRQLELLIKEASAPGTETVLTEAEFEEVFPILVEYVQALAAVGRVIGTAARSGAKALGQMARQGAKAAGQAAKKAAKDFAKEKAQDAVEAEIEKATSKLDKKMSKLVSGNLTIADAPGI